MVIGYNKVLTEVKENYLMVNCICDQILSENMNWNTYIKQRN